MTGTREITVSEALGLHELLMQDATMIDKLAVYVEEAEDRDLESMFRANLRKFEQHYNELIGFVGGESSFAGTEHGTFSPDPGTAVGSSMPGRQAVRPQPMGRLQDRTMLMDCLIACKEIAVCAVTVATECSSTALRRTLADMSRHHLDMAYDLYKHAEQHGWYPELHANENPGTWLRSTHLPIRGTTAANGWRGYEQTAYNAADAYGTGAMHRGQRRAPAYDARVSAATHSAGGAALVGQPTSGARPFGDPVASGGFGAPSRGSISPRGYGDREGGYSTQ